MADETTDRAPMPPVLWWIFGMVAVCFLVMWGVGGLSRTLWWLGLLIGSVALAVVTLWIKHSLDYENGFHTVADMISRLFWVVALLIFLFGVVVTGQAILGPIWSAFSGSDRYSDDLPENWRR